MTFIGSDAIILESNGRFALVDAGEDDEWPDGSDPRYPKRWGTTSYRLGYSARLEAYLQQLGVEPGKVDFFVGTHPHSDHMGYAHDFIEQYKPSRVYTPEYDDSWLWSPYGLFDNRWVYDRTLEAAKDVGAVVIQRFSPTAPEYPTGDSAEGNPVFQLGDMTIEIVNYDADYARPNALGDANLISLGVKVTAAGHSVFLAGDIQKTDGAELRLGKQIGHVDALKLGHHGLDTSSSPEFLDALDPSIVVQTDSSRVLAPYIREWVNKSGAIWWPSDEVYAAGGQAVVLTLDETGVKASGVPSGLKYRKRIKGSPGMTAYEDGLPTRISGWHTVDGAQYWFENSTEAARNRWLRQDGHTYYLQDDGSKAVHWGKADGQWYKFTESGDFDPRSGWVLDDGEWFLLNNGAMVTGWHNSGGTWYYLDPAKHGAMATGWAAVGGTWYYFNASGAMATGWVHSGSEWFYLSGSGAMATGWLPSGSEWYYLSPSGAMATGIVTVDGYRSAFAPSGAWIGYV